MESVKAINNNVRLFNLSWDDNSLEFLKNKTKKNPNKINIEISLSL